MNDIPESVTRDIPKSLPDDIAAVMLDLDKIRTPRNRDTIVWTQYVLTACLQLSSRIFDRG